MSFGVVAASYLGVVDGSGNTIQSNSGTWTGTTMSVSLPGATSSSSLIVLIVAGNVTVTTPAGWTLRESQVNWMGHYLYTATGTTGASWNLTTATGVGTWWIGELASTGYDVGASSNDTSGAITYMTPNLTPTGGNRLIVASIAGANPTDDRAIVSWTNGFTEIAGIVCSAGDRPMQGVACLSATADGVTSYSTEATYNDFLYTKSAIIASFIV